ncbi:MAG: ComEC/Rec2 family competence protein [Bacillota bacterium]
MGAVGSFSSGWGRPANFRPVVVAALAFGTGIFLSVRLNAAWMFYALGAAAALIALAVWKRRAGALLALSLLILGCLRGVLVLPDTIPEGEHELSGTIAATPEGVVNGWGLTLRSVRVDDVPIKGNIRLYAFGMGGDPGYGDRIAVKARLSEPRGARNQGELDLRLYYLQQGIVATAASSGEVLRVPAEGADVYGMSLALKQSLAKNIRALFPSNYGLIEGILLGDTDGISDADIAAFRDTGTAHLLAVSGLNISIFAVGLAFLLRRTKALWRLLIIGAFLLVYCMVTGFAASIVRASVMAMNFLIASALGRRNDLPTSLAAAGLIILCANPFELFSAGFQLSFAAVAAMLMLYEPLMKLFSPLYLPLRQNFSVSLSAALGTLPIGLLQFHRIALIGIFANLIVVPVASIVLFVALGAVLIGYVSMAAASPVAAGASLLVDGMRAVIRLFAEIPGAVATIALPGIFAGALFYALLFSASKFCLLDAPKRRLLAGVLGFMFLASAILPRAFAPELRITVLAREKAAPVCAHCGNRWLLLAAGDSARTISDYLAANGRDRLDIAVVASESDAEVVLELSRTVQVETTLIIIKDPVLFEALGRGGLACRRFSPGSSIEIDESTRVFYAQDLTLEHRGWVFSVGGKTKAAQVGISRNAKELSQPMRIYAGDAADGAQNAGAKEYSTAEYGQIDLYYSKGSIRVEPFVQPK